MQCAGFIRLLPTDYCFALTISHDFPINPLLTD
jgi:hypothetical protein